jgi:hypothetical protein
MPTSIRSLISSNFPGVQGVQGIAGQYAAQGIQGFTGPSGGPTGAQGAQGIQGIRGFQGTQGIFGNQGLQGLNGLYAAQGIQGVQGRQGIQGIFIQGTTGAQGLQGLSGTSFNQGLQGLQGIQGPGFNNVPRSGTAKGIAYTLVKSDVGQYIEIANTNGSIIVPPNIFETGDIVSIANNCSGNINITTSQTTMYLAGQDVVKTTIIVAPRGLASILFMSANICIVSGTIG